jgi:hypothetical protein
VYILVRIVGRENEDHDDNVKAALGERYRS